MLKQENKNMDNKMAIHTYLSAIESKKENKQKKQTRNRIMDTESILVVAGWERVQENG